MQEAPADRKRRLARERQARHRAKLAATEPPLATRYCLACTSPFEPRRADSWFCSRRCIERVSWHRKQARKAELAGILAGVRETMHGSPVHQTLEQLQARWLHDPRPGEVAYRLWFPDLCGLNPDQALAEREAWQQLARTRHQPATPKRFHITSLLMENPPNGKRVTRPSRWGNPFRVGQEAPTAAEAVALFRDHLAQRPALVELAQRELRGFDLGCTCPLDQPCHADVWLEVANR